MKKIMKDLPISERPYEKCLKYGESILSDAELLAVIIRTGTSGESAIELANTILSYSNTEEGILGLINLTIPELKKIKGIGDVKAIQLKCIVELSKRIAKASVRQKISFTTPDAVAEYYMPDLRIKEREELLLILLNTKNHLIYEEVLSRGTVNASLVSPREIFLEAFKYHAVSILLVHNHPSGDPTPSREDVSVTRRIKETGDLIGITLIDHVIIGDNKYVSMKERGIL